MSYNEEPVERHRAVLECDLCFVREVRYFDAGTVVEWEHEWRQWPVAGLRLDVCSAECLERGLASARETLYAAP